MTDKRFVIRSAADVPANPVDHSRGATIQVLLGPADGVPNFVTRRFTIEPGGAIPSHRHANIEHEQVVLDGSMVVTLDGEERTVGPGDCLFIAAGVVHSYHNRSKAPVHFLCVVPRTDVYRTEWLE
jgi:quercetin dioxygenase-like cupin family protein